MVSDRVGDFIIRLKNAASIGVREVPAPYSAHILAIAEKLKELGFLDSVEIRDDSVGSRKDIIVSLAYDERGAARLRGVKRVSKPGRRLYVTHTDAHTVKGGTGVRVISSSRGIVSDIEARKDGIGGEDLFEIW